VSKFPHKALLIAGLAFGVSQFAVAEDKKKEKPELLTGASTTMIADTCAGCHGTDGSSKGPATPTIAGLSPDYIVEVMEGFKSGEIPSTIMGRIAKGYSTDEFKQMAEFFSKKTFTAASGQESDEAMAKKGAKLHDKYCEKCHAEGGTSAEDDAGILAGQWKPYLTWALADFHSGAREMPKKMKKKMKKLMKKEGDDGIKALIEFYSSAK
jgi:sulfide dehydrogenase cytochrome subunit